MTILEERPIVPDPGPVVHHHPSGLLRWLTSSDHKDIGIAYMVTAFSFYLIGGLTPRYLVPARPPAVPAHAGTMDVDIVIDLQILADTQAYQTLEENLKKLGFERAVNEKQQKLSWRWQTTKMAEVIGYTPDAPQNSTATFRRSDAGWIVSEAGVK